MTEDQPNICPFRIVVDNQEQAPWRFTGIASSDGDPMTIGLITDRHLPTGDYSIEGFEDRITLERKSLSDFYGSIGAGHEREERKAERMSHFEYAAYIIEADWQELLQPPSSSQVPAAVARGTIAAWALRYRIGFWLMPGRRNAEVWCFRLLGMFWRLDRGKRKELAKMMGAL